MNKSSRNQIIAAKEKLHQVAEEAREAEDRNTAQTRWEAAQEEERARVEARQKEEADYLKRHNKTVKQVLSQVAKTNSKNDIDDQDESEETEEESEDIDSESQSERRVQDKQVGTSSTTQIGKFRSHKQFC